MPQVEAPAATPKVAWRSKTVLANLLLPAAAELYPPLQAWIATHPHTTLLVAAGLNLALRHVTAGGLSYALAEPAP